MSAVDYDPVTRHERDQALDREAEWEHRHADAIAGLYQPEQSTEVRRCTGCGCIPSVAPCRSGSGDEPGCSWIGDGLCSRCG